jgi:hypothetical protein
MAYNPDPPRYQGDPNVATNIGQDGLVDTDVQPEASNSNFRSTTFDLPIYGGHITFAIGDDVSEMYRRTGFTPEIDMSDAEAAVHQEGNSGVFLLCVTKPGETLVHELYHLTRLIMHCYRLKLDDPGDEAGAYLIGWLYDQWGLFMSGDL